MAILTDQQATLHQGEVKSLARLRFGRLRVTLTGLSGEFATIPFQTKTNGFRKSGFFEASEVTLRAFQAFPTGEILATTPEGVGELDIVYEVRTRADA